MRSSFLAGCIAVTLLSGIVLVHEAGHFVAAKCLDVGVARVSLGLGPVVTIGGKRAAVTIGTTEYAMGWIPIGGYCMLMDELFLERLSEREIERIRQEEPARWQMINNEAFRLSRRGSTAQVFICFAGSTANFLSALLVLAYLVTRFMHLPVRMLELVENRRFIGPIGLIKSIAAAARENRVVVIWRFTQISLGVGFINLFPIPPLDGFKIMVIFICELMQASPATLAIAAQGFGVFLLYLHVQVNASFLMALSRKYDEMLKINAAFLTTSRTREN